MIHSIEETGEMLKRLKDGVYVVAEIGINHNGDLQVAKELLRVAANAGCQAVKFQKRTPEVCTPREQWNIERDTPWGRMTYIDYRKRVEFDADQYWEIDREAKYLGIDWFTSCWDEPAVDFMEDFNPVAYKVASASVTDLSLLRKLAVTGRPVILSTGMSTLAQIGSAVNVLPREKLIITHSTSSYPCSVEELNLNMISTLRQHFGVPIGYSGHEVGLAPTLAAVALGAQLVERHITLDRSMWGSDQAASVEPQGLERLVRDIRAIEKALGDGVKRVYESELGPMQKLRRFQ